MKLIKQEFKIENQADFTLVGIKKFIEKCARVCYKSEDKITEDSYKQFVANLIKNDHGRPLEFGTVYLTVPSKGVTKWLPILWKLMKNPYTVINSDEKNDYITTNYRVIIDNHFEDILKFLSEPTEFHAKRHTVHFILSRAILDEFRTHVRLSHLAESTRYCAYNKDKFGNELIFILPHWWYEARWNVRQFYTKACRDLENRYIALSKSLKPQDARDILPLGIKSELISCGFDNDWENFFYRRDDIAAHPMAQQVAKPLHEEFRKRGYCK